MKKRLDIAVCDDELKTLDIIMATVQKCFSAHDIDAQIDGFRTPGELWQTLGKQSYNLVFLDINMPETDGVALGKKISELQNRPDIIFVSSNTDRVFDTFVVNPFGFVRKSEFLKDIASVIDRYVEKRSNGARPLLRFDMKDRGGLVALDVSRLKYVERQRNEQMFYMDGMEDQTVRSRMEELEKTLAPYDFVRIHKGYLVNYAYIKRFDGNDVTLVSGEVLPIGRSKRADAMEKYLEYVHKNGTSIIG